MGGYHLVEDGTVAWNGYQFHRYPGPNQMKKISDPKDNMVDVVNNLGLKLLAVSPLT